MALSDEVSHLKGDNLSRYNEKVSIIGLSDPYLLPDSMFKTLKDSIELARHGEPSVFPEVQFGDIYTYLIDQSSVYTKKTLKAFKSLDAYRYFIAGWVKDVKLLKRNGHFLVKAKVSHSQRLSDSPSKLWLWIKEDGDIQFGHCSCIAAPGEVCSHVAATAFCLEAAVKLVASQTRTSQQDNQPELYEEAVNINFTSFRAKRKSQEERTETVKKVAASPSTWPIDDERRSFYEKLAQVVPGAAVLSMVPEHYKKSC